MRFMVLVKADTFSESGELPDAELMSQMGAYNEALMQAGILVAGEGLHPSSRGVRVQFSGTQRTVLNGPFPHTRELVAGYWIWQCASLEEAIEWAKKCPNPMPGDSDLEIRQIYELDELGDAVTPEIRAQEDRLRVSLQRQQAGS